jgi:hypothetical protein
MSHPDDGTFQALLDGELAPGERQRVEAHLASCAACAARLEEARGFMEEADRLVEVLEVPARPAEPVVPRRRRVALRTMAWAATIVIAVGVGYWSRGPGLGRDAVPPKENRAPTVAALPEAPSATGAASPAPSSPTETKDAVKEAIPTTAEAKRQPPAPAPSSAPPEAKTAGRNRPEAQANQVAAGGAPADEAAAPAWRVISMEEAVRQLGGQIRLIDGLTPERVESGPGTAVAGADPSRPVVRVVYGAGTIMLDEQRPVLAAEAPAAARLDAAAKATNGVARQEMVTGWREEAGVRYVVTGSVSEDSLRALGARVR